MAALEQVQQMKQQGMTNDQIITSLQEQGISPKEINDAIAQSDVKTAVNTEQQAATVQQPAAAQGYDQSQYAAQDQTAAYPQDQYAGQEAGDGQQGYSQQAYPQDQYYQQATDTETIREIAKQIIETEMEKTNEQVSELMKLKTELKFQIQNMDNRLTKIEESLEGIQLAILKRVADYGEAVQDISKDLKSTQESFSKLINPLVDQKRGKPTPKTKKSSTSKSRSSKESGDSGFEDYFR